MMTNATFFQNVINANLGDEMTEKAKHLLSVTESKSVKRDGEKSALATANLAIANAIAETMEKGIIYAVSEISPKFPDMSTSKISAVMAVGVANGVFIKIDGYKVGGKGRAVKGYSLVQNDESEG